MIHSNKSPLFLNEDIEKIRNKKILYFALKISTDFCEEKLRSLSELENIDLISEAILKTEGLNLETKEIIKNQLINNIRLIKKIKTSFPRAIIFDCDGTLVTTELINRLTFQKILKPDKEKLTPHEVQNICQSEVSSAIDNLYDDKEIQEIFEEVFSEEIEIYKEEYRLNPEAVFSKMLIDQESEIFEEKKLLFIALYLSSQIKGLTFKTAFDTILSIRLPGQFDDLQDFRQTFRSHNKEIKTNQGVKPTKGTKEFLAENSLPFLLASNSPSKVIMENTESLDIPEALVLSSHDLEKKRGKPHPDVFLKALHDLDSGSKRTIIVEDSKPGILAGLSAGICTSITNELSKKLRNQICELNIPQTQINTIIQKLISHIMQIITEEEYTEIIINSLDETIFKAIGLEGDDQIKQGLKTSFTNLIQSNLSIELEKQINNILKDFLPEPGAYLIEQETIKIFLTSILEITMKNLPQIIIFNNGDNQSLCDHQSFLSISDMRDLNFFTKPTTIEHFN